MFYITRYTQPKSILDLKLNLISFLKYYTIWILLADILYLSGIVKNIELFLIFSHVFIIFFCFQIFYIKPKEFKTCIYSIDIIFKGKYLLLLDLLFHYLPFFLILQNLLRNQKSISINQKSLFLLIFLPTLYSLVFNIKKIYQFEKEKAFFQYIILLALTLLGKTIRK